MPRQTAPQETRARTETPTAWGPPFEGVGGANGTETGPSLSNLLSGTSPSGESLEQVPPVVRIPVSRPRACTAHLGCCRSPPGVWRGLRDSHAVGNKGPSVRPGAVALHRPPGNRELVSRRSHRPFWFQVGGRGARKSIRTPKSTTRRTPQETARTTNRRSR